MSQRIVFIGDSIMDAGLREDAARHNGGNAALAHDGVHPTTLGNSLIAAAWRAASEL